MIRGIWKNVSDPLNPGHSTRALRRTYISRKGVQDDKNILSAEGDIRAILPRGKTRDMYEVVGTGHLLSVTSDRASSGDDVLKTLIPHKGESLNFFNEFWFPKTEHIVPNHYIRTLNNRVILVQKANRIDIEAIVRGYVYGHLWEMYSEGVREVNGYKLRNGLQLAEELDEPIFTPTTKAPVGKHDVDITKEEAIGKGVCTKEQWEEIEEIAFRLYEFYKKEAGYKGFIIPDFKSEFAPWENTIMQIDEPPNSDSARLWSEMYYEIGQSQESRSFDKEYLRIYRKKTHHDPKHELPRLVVSETSKRYDGAVQVFKRNKSISDINLQNLEYALAQQGIALA